jgi:hypothetical protein
MEVNGNTKKMQLTESPFVHKFEFGGDKGYWTGNHMILQVEDCIDCLRVLFTDQYDFAFLFDHSSGHAKKRVGGLSVSAMNKGMGGEKLRSTFIEKKEGLPWSFPLCYKPEMVQVGEEHQLVYPAEGEATPEDGPFHLSAAQKESSMHNLTVELPPEKNCEKEKTKMELVNSLIDTDHGRNAGRITLSKMTVRELRKLASNLGMATTRTVTQRFIPGWAGKGKGLLQVLWEQGWIDETKTSQYKKVVTDDAGFPVKEFSLAMMLESCIDFANEKTQLEFVCESHGAEALITTKYQAEYAGEGIEYSWGAAKSIYRCYPLASKKGKEKFVDLVLKCTSREVLTTEMMRKFSCQARSYMLSYKALEILGEQGTGGESDTMSLDITHKQIENMQKIIRSHRAALDFDRGYITSAIKLTTNLDLKEEIEIGPQKKKRGRKRQHH